MLKFLKAIREFTENLKLIKPSLNDEAKIEEINQNMDIIDEFSIKVERLLGEMETNKLDRGGFLGTAKNLLDEISKIASTTQFGRFKVGTNLRIDENGFLHGNPAVDISGKLDKGDVPVKYDTAEKIGIELDKKQNIEDNELITNAKTIVGAINENYEKFKNFCPVPIGWLAYIDTEEHPATRYLGTTWVKLEDVFIKGTKSGEVSGQTGGSNTKTITQANLPNVKLKVDSFNLGRGTQEITGTFAGYTVSENSNVSGAFTSDNAVYQGPDDTDNNIEGQNTTTFTASRSWTGMSTSASPYTSALGSGTPLDITPSFYTVHIWKRLT